MRGFRRRDAQDPDRGNSALPLQEPPPSAVGPGVPELVEGRGSLLIWGLSGCDDAEEFVVDGTAVPVGYLEERFVRERAVLLRPIIDIKSIYDIRGGHVRVCAGDAVAGHLGGHGCASAWFDSLRGWRVFREGELRGGVSEGHQLSGETVARVFVSRSPPGGRGFSAQRYRRRKNCERGAAVFDRVREIPYRDTESVASFVVFRTAAHNVRRMLMLEALAGLFVRIGGGR